MSFSLEDINAQIAGTFGEQWHVGIPKGYSQTQGAAWGLDLYNSVPQVEETVRSVAKAVLRMSPDTTMVFYGQKAYSRVSLGL